MLITLFNYLIYSYQVVQFHGMSHNPTFTFEVSIGEMSAIGTGNSKKQAKHAAASKFSGPSFVSTLILQLHFHKFLSGSTFMNTFSALVLESKIRILGTVTVDSESSQIFIECTKKPRFVFQELCLTNWTDGFLLDMRVNSRASFRGRPWAPQIRTRMSTMPTTRLPTGAATATTPP